MLWSKVAEWGRRTRRGGTALYHIRKHREAARRHRAGGWVLLVQHGAAWATQGNWLGQAGARGEPVRGPLS